MSDERLLKTAEDIKSLANRLDAFQEVKRFDNANEPQAWTLAYNFAELEQSFRKFVDALLPRLTRGDFAEPELKQSLHKIGEELRHILYHIKAPEYYRYLIDDEIGNER